jgi:hypothetical protein
MILSKRTWFIVSGITWLGIGIMLLTKGLRLAVAAAEQTALATPLLKSLLSIAGTRHQAALLIVCLGLFIGFIKGRTVLAKTVARIAGRINAHPEGLSLQQAYDRKYWIILCLMMSLGVLFRIFTIPADIRGLIDIAVGSALINGAMLYFRHILVPQKSTEA